MKNEGYRNLTSEETIGLGQKSTEDEVWSEREVFWEVKRRGLSSEIEEK